MTPYAEEASQDVEAPYAIPVHEGLRSLRTSVDDVEYVDEDVGDVGDVGDSQLTKWSSLCFIFGLGVLIFGISTIFYIITMYC